MNTTRRKRRIPELKVVLDTNAIFSASGVNLLKHEVYELVKATSHHKDLIINWYLPETVKREREYQLRQMGLGLLPGIEKVEKLLGHNLMITEQIIIQSVSERIATQITELNLSLLPIDVSKVDWERVMVGAAFRQPPFSPTEKEKGFRDALILEALLQLVEGSPSTPSICRIALLTNDELLSEATRVKTIGAENVRVLTSIEELKGLINTLVSTVDEEFIQKLKTGAAALFFESKNEESLFYKEKIKDRLLEKFAGQMNALPEGAAELKRGKLLIGGPRFKKKVGQRIHWVSRLTFQMEAYGIVSFAMPTYSSLLSEKPLIPGTALDLRRIELTGPASSSADPKAFFDLMSAASQGFTPQSALNTLASPMSQATSLYKVGQIVFEVSWSVAVTTGNKLSKPKIESLDYVETVWA